MLAPNACWISATRARSRQTARTTGSAVTGAEQGVDRAALPRCRPSPTSTRWPSRIELSAPRHLPRRRYAQTGQRRKNSCSMASDDEGVVHQAEHIQATNGLDRIHRHALAPQRTFFKNKGSIKPRIGIHAESAPARAMRCANRPHAGLRCVCSPCYSAGTSPALSTALAGHRWRA